MKHPNYSPLQLGRALDEFRTVVGSEWVFSSIDDIALYRDAYSPFRGEPTLEYRAAGAVAPANVEEVQALVRIANHHGIPLHPVSTGRNLGYGGAAPTLSGSVVIDLKRMNRILEVNEKESFVLLEPGVSFFELYQFLRERNIRLMVSTPEPGWGSPVGNALDHGVGGVAGDNFGQVVGVEVVLPTGELLRSGCGAAPNSRLWQNYRYGFGPYIDGIFSQSNFGIVTKMGFWLRRAIGELQAFQITSFESDDLGPMIERLQILRDLGLVPQGVCASPIRSSTSSNVGHTPLPFPEVRALLARRESGTPKEWNALGRRYNVPVSAVFGQVRGPAEVNAAALSYARKLFSDVSGAEFSTGPALDLWADPDTVNEGQKTDLGIPNLYGFNRLAVQGTSHGHYYLSPLVKPNAADLFALNDTIRHVMMDAGDTDMLERYGWQNGLGSYPKAFIILIDFLIYDDVELNRRRRALFKRIATACAAKGWTEYRTPVAFHDLVMNLYNFNNNSLLRFHERLKDTLDPNGILSPGKSGIWPESYRKG